MQELAQGPAAGASRSGDDQLELDLGLSSMEMWARVRELAVPVAILVVGAVVAAFLLKG